jgi:hypothetical protein
MPKYKTGSTPPQTHTNTRKGTLKHKNHPTKTTTPEKALDKERRPKNTIKSL